MINTPGYFFGTRNFKCRVALTNQIKKIRDTLVLHSAFYEPRRRCFTFCL